MTKWNAPQQTWSAVCGRGGDVLALEPVHANLPVLGVVSPNWSLNRSPLVKVNILITDERLELD